MKFLANSKVFAYIFYVLAIIFGLYTIMAMVVAIQTITYTVTSGMYGSVPFSEMLTYFFTQAGPYLFYTCVLFFCGYAIQLIAGEVKPKEEVSKKEEPTTIEPSSSYSGTLETTSTPEAETDNSVPEADTDNVEEINFVTGDVADDVADLVEDDMIEEDKPVITEEIELKDGDDIPVIENDADLTEEKLDDIEEAIVEFDKENPEEGEGIDDTML